ncbi:MAG: head GIN domain-containing protein [Candidatus Edwardsbacteria bacterium]|nr:head GIN domain-containing protein [Candidatus Edwardsbacteria bacterium]
MKGLNLKPAVGLIVVCLALISAMAHAGQTISQSRDVSGFDKIQVNGAYDLYLTQGKEFSLRIEAEPEVLEKVKTEVNDGWLKVGDKKHKIRIGVFKSKARKIYVTLPELKELCLNGSSDVRGQNKFKAGDLRLEVNGAGDVELELEAGDVAATINGAGDIKLKGTAENFNISIDGAGDISASDLASQKASVRISGAGDCRVNASQELTVNIAGSGDVGYQGSPKVVTKNVSGVGRVHKE